MPWLPLKLAPMGQCPEADRLAFGKLKRLPRAAAARTADALEAAIGAALGRICQVSRQPAN